MLYIFYDLETTDINMIGQILNYSFVAVDEDYKEVNSFDGKIKISRTQLPQPGAILANKVDVLEHQKEVTISEPQAMKNLRDFFEDCIADYGHIKLIGFNSARFDLNFIRTSMLRNGVSPYFPAKNISYGDVLHVAQYLSATNKEFQNAIGMGNGSRPSLSLSNLCKVHNILEEDEVQLHESRADVDITISLAKTFKTLYDTDIMNFKCYQAKHYETNAHVVEKVFPDWEKDYHVDPESDLSGKCDNVCLLNSGNYSLWINLDKYKELPENYTEDELKSCVYWYNSQSSQFFVSNHTAFDDLDEDTKLLVSYALEDCAKYNLDNFFPERNCDLEQFIYMMPFSDKDALFQAIWLNDKTNIKKTEHKLAKKLYLRHILAHMNLNEQTYSLFKTYCLYRYGGKLKTNRFDTTSTFEDGVYNESFHSTYNEMLNELREKKKTVNASDKKLLESLETFYLESPVTKIAGEDLVNIIRNKDD